MKRTDVVLAIATCLLAADLAARLGATSESAAHAQQGSGRRPIQLTAAPTKSDNFILYRMWDDGSIDVRLVNPLKTQAGDWPESTTAGLSYQDGWKVFQKGP